MSDALNHIKDETIVTPTTTGPEQSENHLTTQTGTTTTTTSTTTTTTAKPLNDLMPEHSHGGGGKSWDDVVDGGISHGEKFSHGGGSTHWDTGETITEEPITDNPPYVIKPIDHMPTTMKNGSVGIHSRHPEAQRNRVQSLISTRTHLAERADSLQNIPVPYGTANSSPGIPGLPINRGSVTPLFQGESPEINENDRRIMNSHNLEDVVIPKERGALSVRQYASYDGGDSPTLTDTTSAMPKETLSPLHPFIRSNPTLARVAVLRSYNRTKLPIVDVEHRKAFRHIFITRPECYIMASGDDLKAVLSDQCANDETMMSSYTRFPHISEILSPVYVVNNPGEYGCFKYANWNYLLSNRVQGLSVAGTTLGSLESVTSSVRGASVHPGTIINSMNNGSLELSFRDTRYMDIYEMIRLWMWYIHKRRTGELFPPFNGYRQQNDWTNYSGNTSGYRSTHPYDRALEYCASLYDIVVDETGTKLLYWCKYYGIYPTSLTDSMLSNEQNSPLGLNGAIVSANFKYQYKEENLLKTLAEFNFNAGIANSLGETMTASEGVLLNNLPSFRINDHYIGASGMFTGSPFIVADAATGSKSNPYTNGDRIKTAYLYFAAPADSRTSIMNVGLQSSDEIVPMQRSEHNTSLGKKLLDEVLAGARMAVDPIGALKEIL